MSCAAAAALWHIGAFTDLCSGSVLPSCVLWFWLRLRLRQHGYLTENSCPDGPRMNTACPSSDLMMSSPQLPNSPMQEDNSGHFISKSILKKGWWMEGMVRKDIKIPAEIQFEKTHAYLFVVNRNELIRQIWLTCICIPKCQCTNYHFLLSTLSISTYKYQYRQQCPHLYQCRLQYSEYFKPCRVSITHYYRFTWKYISLYKWVLFRYYLETTLKQESCVYFFRVKTLYVLIVNRVLCRTLSPVSGESPEGLTRRNSLPHGDSCKWTSFL